MPTFNSSHSDYAVLAERYEDFVGSSPYGTFMQSVGWAQVKNNWDADYVYVEDEAGNIKAAMSLLSISNDGGRSSFTYGPGAPVCDFSDRELVEELIAEAEPVLRQRHSFLLRLGVFQPWNRGLIELWQDSPYVVRSQELLPRVFTNPRTEMVLDLADFDAVDPLASFSSKTRNKIRKAGKNGVSTRYVTVDSSDYYHVLDEFYRLIEIMAQRHGISHRPYVYFDRLIRAYPNARLWISEHESGQVLAACIVISYNQVASYVYSASSDLMRHHRATYQMNYEAIAQAVSEGMCSYNMGGILAVDPTEGLYQFKESFTGKTGVREYFGELDIIRDHAGYGQFTA
ncbi:lipid II:glycine glycyltransferase FemX [Arcanobacterium buesumense]|uniref:Aminoacyltransferase n=1 Tax=Arcanobacterium buesumense TaxID=2722751 RepID=A0A6H2EJP4_9ACTO|nr:peptidoglycan bridge formation glycyltransferase FemA/FemB family protein [Arcanobacterium buesumense]QJC21420.1 aminoacyltransferase [Arcanobacterium buesumense]